MNLCRFVPTREHSPDTGELNLGRCKQQRHDKVVHDSDNNLCHGEGVRPVASLASDAGVNDEMHHPDTAVVIPPAHLCHEVADLLLVRRPGELEAFCFSAVCFAVYRDRRVVVTDEEQEDEPSEKIWKDVSRHCWIMVVWDLVLVGENVIDRHSVLFREERLGYVGGGG